MINVIHRTFALFQIRDVPDCFDQIFFFKNSTFKVDAPVELLINLVPTDATEVVPARIKKQTLDERIRIRHSGRISRTEPTVNIFERLFGILGWILLETLNNHAIIHHGIYNFNFVDSEVLKLPTNIFSQRLESACDNHAFFFVLDIGDKNFCAFFFTGGEVFQLHIFNLIKKFENIFVFAIAKRPKERGNKEFPATMTAVKINIE